MQFLLCMKRMQSALLRFPLLKKRRILKFSLKWIRWWWSTAIRAILLCMKLIHFIVVIERFWLTKRINRIVLHTTNTFNTMKSRLDYFSFDVIFTSVLATGLRKGNERERKRDWFSIRLRMHILKGKRGKSWISSSVQIDRYYKQK